MDSKTKERSSYEWSPWHGCTKKSEGCLNCYVYRGDARRERIASITRRTLNYDLPIKKDKKGNYKIPSGKVIFTCFQSDFLIKDADPWRDECFKMMKERSDCFFVFFTKRPERLLDALPSDWGNGYDNVEIGVTVENQKRADERLPIFMNIPMKHRMIIVEPMLEEIDIEKYLREDIEEVTAGGESGPNARVLNFDWIVSLRDQCERKNVHFSFHQTGKNFIKDGIHYDIQRKYQRSQAKKANIDYLRPKRIKFGKKELDSKQLSFDFDLDE